jgi:hypothetical protein
MRIRAENGWAGRGPVGRGFADRSLLFDCSLQSRTRLLFANGSPASVTLRLSRAAAARTRCGAQSVSDLAGTYASHPVPGLLPLGHRFGASAPGHLSVGGGQQGCTIEATAAEYGLRLGVVYP